MKKTSIMYKMFATMAFVAVAAMAMVGCKKDPDPITPIIPDEPEQPEKVNYFVAGTDSLKIDAIQMSEMDAFFGEGKMCITIFYLSNGTAFEGMSFTPTDDSTTIQFVDMFTFLFTSQGCYASMLNLMGDDDDADDMASGAITFVKTDADNWRISVEGTTASGKAVSAMYEGGVIDNNHPTGTGSFTVADKSFDLSLAMLDGLNNGYTYSFVSSSVENGIDIFGNQRINGEMVVTDKDASQLASNEVNMSLYYLDKNADETIDLTITNGSLSTTRQGSNYTISFSGTTPSGAVSGSYTGSIVEVGSDFYTKHLLNKARKACKK
ncbi:MAG: hypothetical protein MJZ99_09460 [Bacteroidales bacterium]|nr:hypothetical protein [Bacteroidales bacterium]